MKDENLVIEELLNAWEETYKKGQLTLWVFLALREGRKCVEEIKEFVIEERAYDREQAEEQIDWWRKMAENEQYLEEQRIDAWREVGVSYGENQPEENYKMWWME